MSLVPKAPVLYTAIAGLALLAGALITATRRARRSLLAWCAIVTVAMYGFLAWKEGFTRSGDWHTFVFLWYLPLGLAFLFLHEFASGSEVSHQRVLEVAFAASMSLCLLAAHFQIPGLALQQATGWPQRIAHSAKAAFTILRGSANGLYAGCRDPGNLQMLRLDHARDVIGNESVDVMNYLLLAAVGNDMNYQPRPVIQGFVAYTPTLQALNEKYFQSPGRPHFVMLCQESTDNRFPALEDSAALNYILNNYAPAARDGKFLILKQRTAEDPTFKLMHEERVQFSEPLDLRPWARKALFLSVVIKPSLLGRVAELLYQQHPLYMQVSRNQEVERFRIVPSMAERPFLLNPVLKSNYDVLNFYASQPGKVVDSVTFERPGAASLEFQDQLTVRLYAAPAFPRAMKGVPVPRMLADVQGRVFWPRPKSFESAAPARLMIFHGTAAIMVRDPSKIVMEIPENANSFSGYFGVPQEANPGSANAAGVLISIVVQDDAGRIRWRLDRVAQPAPSTHDHGRIAFRVPIDSSQDRTITLTTGPANGGKGGWSVWSQCRFDNARCAAGALECCSGSYRLSYRTPISSAN
jgi:hypothetical protein